MEDVKIEFEEEGDPEVNELKERVRLLEHQNQQLVRAVLLIHAGSEIGSPKYKNLTEAVNDDRDVLIQLDMRDGTWPELVFQIEPKTPALRVVAIRDIEGRGTVYVCEYLRQDCLVHIGETLRCGTDEWELSGVESVSPQPVSLPPSRNQVGLMLKEKDDKPRVPLSVGSCLTP